MSDEELIEVLSIGAITGVLSNKPWRAAIKQAMQSVAQFRLGHSSPLNLNVVFHLPAGRDFTPEFEGLRTGTFSRKRRTLMVQVAVPDGEPRGDPDEEVRRLLYAAIDVAEEFARMEAVIGGNERLDELRAIVAAI